MTLPIRLSEGEPSPWDNNSLSEEDAIKQKGQVLDHAITTCNKYWHGKRYDSFPIEVVGVPCEALAPLEESHEIVKNFTNASDRKINASEELSEIKKEYQFLVNHCTRKTYQLQFARCRQDSCRYCRRTPIRAENFLKVLNRNNGVLPTPSLSDALKGHYKTMLEQLSSIECGVKSLGIDEGLPSLNGKSPPLCPFGCRYVFSSKADAIRHCRNVSFSGEKVEITAPEVCVAQSLRDCTI